LWLRWFLLPSKNPHRKNQARIPSWTGRNSETDSRLVTKQKTSVSTKTVNLAPEHWICFLFFYNLNFYFNRT
jgi:hypothetical protein